MKKVTIKDIAKALGVTPTTISNVLNKTGRASDELKAKIIKTAKELNYHPNLFARALVSGKTNKIAVIMPGFTSQFGMGVLDCIEKTAGKLDYEVSVFSNTADKDAFKNIVSNGKADAVIAIAMNIDPDVEKLYDDANMPLVLVEGQSKLGNRTIEIDNEKAAYKAVTYLAQKKRKRIAIVTGLVDMALSQKKRIKGYKEALKDSGLEINENFMLVIDKYTFEDGAKAYTKLSKYKIDALFCAAGDMTAAGFINAARADSKRVPEDISVIGFDDIITAQSVNMTTVRQPLQEMGEIAFGQVSSMLGGSKAPNKKTTLDAELIIRGTT